MILFGSSSAAVVLDLTLVADERPILYGSSSAAVRLHLQDFNEEILILYGGSSTAIRLTIDDPESVGPEEDIHAVPDIALNLYVDVDIIDSLTDLDLNLVVGSIASLTDVDLLLDVSDPATLDSTAQVWDVMITLGEDDITDDCIGTVSVEAEEGVARIARFTMRPSGTLDIPDLCGLPVTIDYVLKDPVNLVVALSVRLFTGHVDVPQFDPSGITMSFLCNDGLNNVLGKTTRAGLDQLYVGSYWSNAVFDRNANSLAYAQSLAVTVPGSVDLDPYGMPRLTLWAAKGTADFEYVETGPYGALDASLQVELTERTQVKNMIQIVFQYRYPRLHYRTTAVSWDMGKTLGELFLSDFTIPTRAMIEQAANGLSGWDVTGISYEPPPPTQIIDLGGGDVGVWVCDPLVQAQLAWRTGIGLARRWVQTITEEYVMVVKNELSIEALGVFAETEQASLEVSNQHFDSARWESQKATGAYRTQGLMEPVPTFAPPYNGGTVSAGGFLGGEWIYDVLVQPGVARSDSDQAIKTLMAKAKTRILATHRGNRARFRAMLNPYVDLCHTVRAVSEHLTCKGKASRVIYTMEPGQGLATMEVEMALSGVEGVGSQVEIPIAAPIQPILPGPLTMPSIALPTLFGGNSSSIYPQPEIAGVNAEIALGYHGNQQGGAGHDPTKPYQEGFRVKAPAIAAEDVDPLTVAQYQSHTAYLTADVNTIVTVIQVSQVPPSYVLPFLITITTEPHTVILPDGTFVARSGDEIMNVVAISGTTWEVERAAAGTTAVDHFTGDAVSVIAQPIDTAVPQDELVLVGV